MFSNPNYYLGTIWEIIRFFQSVSISFMVCFQLYPLLRFRNQPLLFKHINLTVFLPWKLYYVTAIGLDYEIFHVFQKLKSFGWGPRLTCQITVPCSELSFSKFPILFLSPAILINLNKLNFFLENNIHPRSFFQDVCSCHLLYLKCRLGSFRIFIHVQEQNDEARIPDLKGCYLGNKSNSKTVFSIIVHDWR